MAAMACGRLEKIWSQYLRQLCNLPASRTSVLLSSCPFDCQHLDTFNTYFQSRIFLIKMYI